MTVVVEPGDRVELIDVQDQFTSLKKGDRGTVRCYRKTPWERQIDIKWDNGSSMMLLEGIDQFRKLTEDEVKKELEMKCQI
jgi:hypothetical protein